VSLYEPGKLKASDGGRVGPPRLISTGR